MDVFLNKLRQRIARDREMPVSQWVVHQVRSATGYVGAAAAGLLLRRPGISVGPWVRISGLPDIENRGHLSIGAHSILVSTFSPVRIVVGTDGIVNVGDAAVINFGTLISAQQRVDLGGRVSIGPYCILSDTASADPARDAFPAAPIVLEDDVWLAAHVTVRPGARIGKGSVITAGSTVEGEIPAGVLAGGIPARVLRALHDKPAEGDAAADSSPPAITEPEPVAAPSAVCATCGPVARTAGALTGLLVSDFTIQELATRLEEAGMCPSIRCDVAPFGQVMPTLMAPPDGHDVVVAWTRPEAIASGFGKRAEGHEVPLDDILAEVDSYCSALATCAAKVKSLLVPTWTLASHRRGAGMLDSRANGISRALTAMNLRLMERMDAVPNAYVLNAERWMQAVGRNASPPKLWYMGKVPFHPEVFEEASRDLRAAAAGLAGQARKLIILDLDDTLWGGIVGDVGWENLRLGGHDAIGEAFVDFQRAIKALQRRGIVLAIVSKNTEEVALEAIRCHPEMLLRGEDFVAWRINWQDKARNVADVVSELNLGLQSVVFIDDNPVERARVREALPEVFVPEWPEDKTLYASTLMQLGCFDAPALSKEDRERTDMYLAERKRESLKTEVGSLDDWLGSLGLRVRAERLNAANLARTTQLLNKTNQMNLSTRRLTENELQAWASERTNEVWAIHVSDKFGDAGLTGIVSLEVLGDRARLADFVLSCRVMGRKVEECMVHLAVASARDRGAKTVEAHYLPTAKNRPCLEFWQRAGWAQQDPGPFTWEATREYQLPNVLRFETDG